MSLCVQTRLVVSADEKKLASALLSSSDSDHTPLLEDALSAGTLWPEVEKLYGHGYEVCLRLRLDCFRGTCVGVVFCFVIGH